MLLVIKKKVATINSSFRFYSNSFLPPLPLPPDPEEPPLPLPPDPDEPPLPLPPDPDLQ